MSITPEQISIVIRDIYGAADGPGGFLPVVRRIRTLLNGSSGMLFTPLNDPSDGGFGFVDHFDTEMFKRYRAACWWDKDPWQVEAERKDFVRSGVAFVGEMLVPEAELQRTQFFHEVNVPLDATRLCCGIISSGEDPVLPRTALSIFRGVGANPFGAEERRTMALLVPHVLQALRLARRLERAESGLGSALDALQALNCGVLLIDAHKRILFMNRRAERLCTRAYGLATDRQPGGAAVLRALLGRDDAALQCAVEAALRILVSATCDLPTGMVSPVSVHRPGGDGVLVLTALSLGGQTWEGDIPQARAVVFVEDPADKQPVRGALFEALFGLTPAECQVACALAAGEKPKGIAWHLSVSENTIRSHIKALYSKTGTRGIAALTAMLSRVANMRASL